MLNRTYPLIICASLLLFTASHVAAEKLVRSSQLLEQVAVQNVTLGMTAAAAFAQLQAAGFKAGSLNSYADWHTNGIEFVRGTYGSPEGFSSVAMSRRGERLISLTETFNSPGNPIDADAAINGVRQQLGIPADAPRCKTHNAHNGSCQVVDAEQNTEVTIRFTLQIMTTMRMVAVSRPRELVSQ